MAAPHRSKLNPRLTPLAAALGLALSGPLCAADSFTGLGFLPGHTWSFALGVSADGSVVVGASGSGSQAGGAAGSYQSFRWTQGSGMASLGTLAGGTNNSASAVSADGSVVVGESWTAAGAFQAYRWTQAGGMVGLGFLPGGTQSQAFGVSGNGAVVVGYGIEGGGNQVAFRWTQAGGMASLGVLLGMTTSQATAASFDGSVVVGTSYGAGGGRAFRWTQSGGILVSLGTLAGGWGSQAYGVSADGAVVVGGSGDSNGLWQAMRWTQAGGMVGLGFLPGGIDSWAQAVSADGAVVVGSSTTNAGALFTYTAFRWTQPTGMQSVAGWLSGAGVTLPAGWTLTNAMSTNSDGSVVVGDGSGPTGTTQAWLARVGGAGSGVLTDVPAFNATVVQAGTQAVQGAAGLVSLGLFGAHHRSLLDSGLARTQDGTCGWATADAAHHNGSNTRMELAEVGVCKDIGATRLGLGVGQTWARQDWSLGGGAKYRGQYLLAEAGTAFGPGLEGSLLAFYGRYSTDLRRSYMNGATVDTSRATPNISAVALRARLDWKDVAQVAAFSLSPYGAYTWTETKLDAYTETGGGFPVAFNAATWRSNDLRLGATGKTALSAATDLKLSLEGVHRFESNGSGSSGQVVGLWSFSLPGQVLKQDWARAIVDLDHRLSKTSLITASANGASTGGDASWGVSLGYRAAF